MSITIENQLADMISTKFKVSRDRVLPDTRFKDDFKADSLAKTMLLMAIEQEFNIEFSVDEVKEIVTLKTLAECLARKGVNG